MVTRTLLSKGGDGAGAASSYLTTAITPLPNNLVLASIETYTNTSTTPTRPTLSGCGIQWTDMGDVLVDNGGAGRNRITLFGGASPTPTAGQLTIDYAGVSQRIALWLIDQYANCVSWRQVATAGPTSATSISATLAAFRSTGNGTAGYALNSDQLVSWTPGTGFADAETYVTASYPAMLGEFRPDNDTSVDASVSSSALLGMIAVELEAAVIQHPDTLTGFGGQRW